MKIEVRINIYEKQARIQKILTWAAHKKKVIPLCYIRFNLIVIFVG